MPTAQLTLELAPHPEIARRQSNDDPVWVTGSLKLSGELDVDENLNAGDRLLVTVAGEDGEVVSRGYFEVGTVAFEPIRDKDLGVIGTERIHKAKRSE